MTDPFIISDEEGRRQAIDHIAGVDLEGKQWKVSVKRYREGRTQRQTRLYFTWVDEVVSHVSDTTGYEKHEVHKFFKDNFLEPGRDIQIKGLTARAEVTTTTLNTAEMSAYMDTIYRWVSAEFGFALRLPPVMVEDGYGGPAPKQANGADDDWRIIANDITNQIAMAPNFGRLEEITAIYGAELSAMKENASGHYDHVMERMERRGKWLDRTPAEELHPIGAG